LKRMERQAKRERIPIIGPTVAPLLTLFASLTKAHDILEIGTAIGYSTIWFATAAKMTNGRVTTVELDENRATEAERNLREAGLSRYVKVIRGDIMKRLPQLKGPYDLIFIDTAKELYLDLLDPCVKRLRKGGVLMADNVLWSGLVAEEGQDEVADLMREFNQRLYEDQRLNPVILPFRDGVAVCQKIS
jgi:predicted O-methyltransferase YrrM